MTPSGSWRIDLYTHSLVAFRLTLVSDTSVDVAMTMDRLLVDLPPAGVLTCAAVIAIADHLLCHPDHALAAGLAREMFLNVHATTSRHQIGRHIPFGSPALRNVLYGRAAAPLGDPPRRTTGRDL